MADLIKQRYQLLDKLGQGGFGAVYKAFDEVLSRDVAIKLLNLANENQEEMVQRFQVESRVASRLEHQNILRVYDFGRDENGRCFLVSELLKGDSLHATLKAKEPLSLSLTLDILYQVGSALEAAHEQNTVHRDIKPPNIFLNQPMRGASFVKLLDFGIAKVIGGNESLTVTGQIMGTPHYMSPEQIVNIKLVDHRSDIYSLGIVFYQMLMGIVPFDDESYFTIMKKQMQSPMPSLKLPHYPADLTKKLSDIIRIMTRKDVRKRVSHISEVLYEVQKVWSDFPQLIQPRTTGVFQSVTADTPRLPLDRNPALAPVPLSPGRGSIEEMLEPFQGADDIVDQLFISEGGNKSGISEGEVGGENKRGHRKESGSGSQDGSKHRRGQVNTNQKESVNQDVGVIGEASESSLPEYAMPTGGDRESEHIDPMATPVTADEFEVAMTPLQKSTQPQEDHSSLQNISQSSSPNQAQLSDLSHQLPGQRLSPEETPMVPTLSASLIDQAPAVDLAPIHSNDMDTVLEQQFMAHENHGSILLNRLILLALLLAFVVLWRVFTTHGDAQDGGSQGLTMSLMKETPQKPSGPTHSVDLQNQGKSTLEVGSSIVIQKSSNQQQKSPSYRHRQSPQKSTKSSGTLQYMTERESAGL